MCRIVAYCPKLGALVALAVIAVGFPVGLRAQQGSLDQIRDDVRTPPPGNRSSDSAPANVGKFLGDAAESSIAPSAG